MPLTPPPGTRLQIVPMPHVVRRGPRPLMLHMTAAANMWLGAGLAAGPWLNLGLNPAGDMSAPEATSVGTKLAAGLAAEGVARYQAFLDGVKAYRNAPPGPMRSETPILWESGCSCLRDLGGDGPPLLLVPSLINGWEVFDLLPENSFVNLLKAVPRHVYVIDWGATGLQEPGLSLDEVIVNRLPQFFDHIRTVHDKAPEILGYCMGGTLALASAASGFVAPNALVVMAAPWDFHAEGSALPRRAAAVMDMMLSPMSALNFVPVDLMQSMFAAIDPMNVPRKFARLAHLPQDSAAFQSFVAVEDWLNGGVPLPLALARQCFNDWYSHNLTGQGIWKIGDQMADPGRIGCPVLNIIAEKDRLVPPGTSYALDKAMPNIFTHVFKTGHIGLMAGRNTAKTVWAQVARWLTEAQATKN